MSDRIDNILRHFPTLLRRWDGAIVRMWQMTSSHQTLLLRLEQHGRVGNLEIGCAGPLFIHGPTVWNDAHIEIVRQDGGGFAVRDERAGVEIRADHVELAENRKPLNAFTICTPGDLAD